MYKRPSNDNNHAVSNFLSNFFAVFLAGFMLLLIARWYVRDSVSLIGSKIHDAGKVYIDVQKERMKKHADENSRIKAD